MTPERPEPTAPITHGGSASNGNTRILLRSRRDVTVPITPEYAAHHNLIGYNSGNAVFGHAVHRVLSVDGARVEVDNARARIARAAEINEEFDCYVMPFANAFRPSFVQTLDKYSELIEQLKIPVVVVGIGVQLNYDGTDPERLEPIRPNINRFMRAVLDRSATVGVRGEITYDYLRSIGYSDSQVTLIGCPSLFQQPSLMVRALEPITADSLVTLNISPYLQKMGPITTANVARYRRLRYVPQDILTLRTMLSGNDPEDASEHDPQIPYRARDPLIRTRRTDFFIDPTTWAKWLGSRDVSFGSRIHGNIVSLLGGTPAYVLAHDSRSRELAEYHEIPFSPLAEVPPDVDPRDLFDKADYTGFHRNHQTRFENYVGFLNTNGIDHIFRGNPADAISVAAFDAQIEAARNKHPVTSGGRARIIARRQRSRAQTAADLALSKVRKRS